MTVIPKTCAYSHRVVAIQDIKLMDGFIPVGAQGWLVSYSHIWNEPNVLFDEYGWAGIEATDIKAIRVRGRLIRNDVKTLLPEKGAYFCMACDATYIYPRAICIECGGEVWQDDGDDDEDDL